MIASILRKNMLEVCLQIQRVSQCSKFSEGSEFSCSLLRTDNVCRQISEHILEATFYLSQYLWLFREIPISLT